MQQMHGQIAKSWTMAQLAKKAALSRSAFFDRFTRPVGIPPIEYQLRELQRTMIGSDLLRSGDIGLIDERGLVFIEDRKKDMILVSGFNVYPNEVESVAVTHPGVLEAAAIAQADERSGEVVALFVVKKDPNLTEQDLIEHCRKALTGYKVPKHVYFRTDLPKTNVGKILRRAWRDELPK